MVGNGLGRWNTMPIRARMSVGSIPEPYTSVVPSSTEPVTCALRSVSCMRFKARRSVVFPDPDGPIRAVTCDVAMSKVTPRTAGFVPNDTDTSRSDMVVMPLGAELGAVTTGAGTGGAEVMVSSLIALPFRSGQPQPGSSPIRRGPSRLGRARCPTRAAEGRGRPGSRQSTP